MQGGMKEEIKKICAPSWFYLQNTAYRVYLPSKILHTFSFSQQGHLEL